MFLYSQGKCFPCADNKCPLMGHYADRFTMTGGISKTKYFLNTGSSNPFGRKYPALPCPGKNKGVTYIQVVRTHCLDFTVRNYWNLYIWLLSRGKLATPVWVFSCFELSWMITYYSSLLAGTILYASRLIKSLNLNLNWIWAELKMIVNH